MEQGRTSCSALFVCGLATMYEAVDQITDSGNRTSCRSLHGLSLQLTH